MKKDLFTLCALISIFSNTPIHGMISSKTRQPYSYRRVQPQTQWAQPQTKKETIYYTKTFQKSPILYDRFKLYYDQVKRNIAQLWYGQNYQQTILDETTALLNDIQNKKSRALESFETFLMKNNQDDVNNLLDKLLFSNQDIEFLNEKIFALLLGISLGNKNNIKITNKIMIWAHKNILRIFSQDLPVSDKFFIISLLNINQTLIPTIHDHLDYIQQQPTGQQFLNLLKSEHKGIYDAVIQRKQPVTGILKEGMQKSLNELRTRE